MKRTLALFLCVVLCCGLVACSNAVEDKTDSPAESPMVTPSQSEPISSPEMSGSGEQSSENPQTTTVRLSSGGVFSEGLAWVTYFDQNGEAGQGLLHTDGSITPTENEAGTPFSGGYSYRTTGDGYIRGATQTPDSFVIMDADGNITAKSPDDGCSYQIITGGDGVYLVKQSIRNMTENVDKYGFISGDGTWIYECSVCEAGGSHPLSLDVIPEDSYINFSYLGEGIFVAEYGRGGSYPHRYGQVLYNTNIKKSFVLDSNDTAIFTADSAYIVGGFSDGYALAMFDDGLRVLTTDFEMNKLDVTVSGAFRTVKYSDGIIFVGETHYKNTTTISDGAFYRIDGSLLVDLSQYTLISEDAEGFYQFYDGYAAIVILGADGRSYLTFVDSNGEFTFEPRQIELTGNYDLLSTFSGGAIICRMPDKGITIIDNVH